MSRQADLGYFRLKHAAEPIEVAVSACATFASTSSQFLAPSTSAFLDRLRTLSVWVCRGRGLKLQVQLSWEGRPLGECACDGNLLRDLGEALVAAEFWTQLDLSPSLTQLGDSISSSPSLISVDIRHAVNETAPKKQANHKLAVGVASSDIRPPSGVDNVGLENVTLKLDLWRPSRECSVAKPTEAAELGEMLIEEELPYEQSFSKLEKHHDARLEHNLPPSIQILINFLDAALRLFIYSRPCAWPSDIHIPEDGRIALLADIAPVLWSPGYIQAVSQRACLLPTIGHALASLAASNIQSTTLKSTFEKLGLVNGITGMGMHDGDERDLATTLSESSKEYGSLPVILWLLVQRSVFKKDAAKKLRFTKQKEITSLTGPNGDIDMLIEPNTASEVFHAGQGIMLDLSHSHNSASTLLLSTLTRGALMRNHLLGIHNVESFLRVSAPTPTVAVHEHLQDHDAGSQFSEFDDLEGPYDDEEDMLERSGLAHSMDDGTLPDDFESLLDSSQGTFASQESTLSGDLIRSPDWSQQSKPEAWLGVNLEVEGRLEPGGEDLPLKLAFSHYMLHGSHGVYDQGHDAHGLCDEADEMLMDCHESRNRAD